VVEGRATVRVNKVDFQDGYTQDYKSTGTAFIPRMTNKHNLAIILEATKAQLDHYERGITLGKSTINTLLTIQHMSCSQQSIAIAVERVNNPAVALPFSVMLWRDICRYDGTGTFDDTRRKRGLSGTCELAST
jgi:hypothetical protein